jgi:hypothetical protein
MLWNDPKRTLPLGSYAKPEPRREASTDRRGEPRRAVLGDRRASAKRVIQALLRI